MSFNNVRWVWAIAGVFVAEAAMIAAAFGWVAIYSYLLHPGQTFAFYQEYAKTASPYVALILGIPAFFLTCRWIGFRAPSTAWLTAMAIFGILCLIEVSTILTVDNPAATAWLVALNLATKFIACYWGGRSAMRAEVQKPA